MKLILLRHAKSGWDDPRLSDHDRQLNARGRASAPLIGRWLKTQDHLPSRILCSSAARTRETLELLGLPETDTTYDRWLYLATADFMLEMIANEDAQSLMVIAHNHGIGELANMLLHEPSADADYQRYPTAACAVLSFRETPRFGAGRLLDFTIPNRLV